MSGKYFRTWMREMELKAMKKEVRDLVTARLAGTVLPEGVHAARLMKLLFSPGEYSHASGLVAFIPYKMEPDILPILQEWLKSGRVLWLPCYDDASRAYTLAAVKGLDSAWLLPGKWGIPEPRPGLPRLHAPFPFAEDTLWLVPGVAFTESGKRLGRGGGYYDRMLRGSGGIRLGMTYDLAVLPDLPSTEHDESVDYLLTETRFIPCT